MNELNNILTQWTAGKLADGQALDDILDLTILPDTLRNRLLESTDCVEPEYLTDWECIELIIAWSLTQPKELT